MNSKELQLIIKCGETSTVQFKERFPNQDSIAAEMVATVSYTHLRAHET